MTREITVAGLQLAFTDDMKTDINATAELVREAARQGGQVILPPELFQGHYFCKDQQEDFFLKAFPADEHPAVLEMQKLAKELKVYIPTSIYERDGHHYYNSLVMVGDEGEIMGLYRKSHIPDGPGYQEKFYFRPGNTGFKVWKTRHGTVGVGICWDQWYPECARAMMLQGAEVLFYPTAIGSEPHDEELDTSALWQRAQIGHAVSNVVPVVAANRIGDENGQHFYGHSFVSSHRGDKVSELGDGETGVVIGTFDLDLIQKHRFAFGFFRDRRPDLYGRLVQDI